MILDRGYASGASRPFSEQAVLAGFIMSQKDDNKGSIKKDWDPGSGSGGHDFLFRPEEFDIYVNKVTLEAYIFHGKPIEKEIEKLIYDPDDHSVTVVNKDGTRLDLGAKLQWLVRPYFTKAKEISIVRTKDGESIDGFMVPLVHKGDENA